MPYRIKAKDDTVQAAVRRIGAEQVARGLRELDDERLDFGEKVHQVRKRCKKMRALLRLVRKSFGDYNDENRAFRDMARGISEVRDRQTLIESYDRVMCAYEGDIDRRAFAPIRARLTRDLNEIRADPDTHERLGRMRGELERAAARIHTWEIDAKGFDALAGGLAKTYKRARKRMDDAWRSPTGPVLHEWRKRTKYHWYHARLLEEINTGMMPATVDQLDQLSDTLGDHHDLVILAMRLDQDDFGPATDLAAFHALAEAERNKLQARAFDLGRRALAERAKARVTRWRDDWDAWSAGEMTEERLILTA
jgi:CHAD domain-containing protein